MHIHRVGKYGEIQDSRLHGIEEPKKGRLVTTLIHRKSVVKIFVERPNHPIHPQRLWESNLQWLLMRAKNVRIVETRDEFQTRLLKPDREHFF
jgi:hypothetical protein